MESAQPGQKKKPRANAVGEGGVRAGTPKGGTGRHHLKASGGSAPRTAGRGTRMHDLAQMTLMQMVKPSVQ